MGKATVRITLALLFFAAGADAEDAGMTLYDRAYDHVRIAEIPIAVQCWTFHKFTFTETLEKVNGLGVDYLQAYPGQVFSPDMPERRFHHAMDDDLRKLAKEKLREHGIRLVAYGVIRVDNTDEAWGELFEFARDMGIRTIVTEPDYDDYSIIDRMVREYGIRVAIHNHPLPSKYARPETVYHHVKGHDPRIGACADTGHWLRTGIRPVEALRLLDGRIMDVHLKDLDRMGDAKNALDVPFGSGVADVRDVLAELTLQGYTGYIAVEHENPNELDNPSPSIRKGIEYLKSITHYRNEDRILARDGDRYHKHGWNHYGPGYFDLCEETGVLTSSGGMGLFWYSEKKFGDFVLDLDYRCTDRDTNSGIFFRIPDIPTSNSYIYHSFEIQIMDSGIGIHKTGAVYDAEAPVECPAMKPGEWNHFTITLDSDRVTVELNGMVVIDRWQMAPRGKIRDFAREGYIGLQNHDSRSPIAFRNIHARELE